MTDNQITQTIACKHDNNACFRFEIDTHHGRVEISLCHRCEAMIRGTVLQRMLKDAFPVIPKATFGGWR